MPKVRHHLRGLPQGGGSPGRTSPEISVSTTEKGGSMAPEMPY